MSHSSSDGDASVLVLAPVGVAGLYPPRSVLRFGGAVGAPAHRGRAPLIDRARCRSDRSAVIRRCEWLHRSRSTLAADDRCGWLIDTATLRPVITDEPALRAQHANDPALDVVVSLWDGDPDGALVAIQPLLAAAPSNRRWRAIRARRLGRSRPLVVDGLGQSI